MRPPTESRDSKRSACSRPILKKPVSSKALLDRIVAIVNHPRAMVRLGDYYGPEPRKLFFEPERKVIAAS